MKTKIFMALIVVMISALMGPPTTVRTSAPVNAVVDRPLVFGTLGLVTHLDPHNAWDGPSMGVIFQVTECLFTYNFASSDMEIVPRLAADCGVWNENNTELTVSLREGVTFHDGNPFNASVVEWNFDRLSAFIIAEKTQIAELYQPLKAIYPTTPLLINNTIVVDEFTVKFKLNYAFAAFVPLLCFTGSSMISPAYFDAPDHNASEFLVATQDHLIGTGPYEYVSTDSIKTVFTAYVDYYRGTPAVKDMEWIQFIDTTTASNALLAGDIDIGAINLEFLDEFEASPDITVGPLMKTTSIRYLGMNNRIINKTFRKAISYAIAYDYIIESIYHGKAARMISPIPEGISYHNPTVQPATYDVEKARGVLIDAGLSKGLNADSTEQEWLDLATFDPIASYNYTYNYGNAIREDLGILLKANCKAIGIKISLTGMTWETYLDRLLGDFHQLELYFIGWGADYNDPANYINPLFSIHSISNGAQVNDSWLQSAMMDALMETDLVSRKAQYFEIQEYIVEDLMPWAFLVVPIIPFVHAKTTSNWSRNPMGYLEFFSISFLGEDAVINDLQMEINCGFEAPWEYFTMSETGDPNNGWQIPGYNLVALIGVAAITIISVIKRRKC